MLYCESLCHKTWRPQVDMNDEAKVHSHLQVCLCVRWLLVVSPGPQPQARTNRQQSVLTSWSLHKAHNIWRHVLLHKHVNNAAGMMRKKTEEKTKEKTGER